MVHKSVLLQTSIEGLNIKKGDTFLDGTLGNGGHSKFVCEQYGNDVKIIGLDAEEDAIARSRERLEKLKCPVTLVQSNFRNLDEVLEKLGLSSVDKILFDLGLSSNQFEESGRGFSFQKDEPLLMTFKNKTDENEITAKEIVNTWQEENLSAIIQGYGEERYARKIAKKIVEERKKKPIETTFELVRIVKEATPKSYHHMKIHPATRTFQAIRIAVNDELGALKDGLQKGFDKLSPGGRIAVISFHSLEDRIVKNFFRDKSKEQKAILITKKPIIPDEDELRENPRSRSAKLRILEKK